MSVHTDEEVAHCENSPHECHRFGSPRRRHKRRMSVAGGTAGATTPRRSPESNQPPAGADLTHPQHGTSLAQALSQGASPRLRGNLASHLDAVTQDAYAFTGANASRKRSVARRRASLANARDSLRAAGSAVLADENGLFEQALRLGARSTAPLGDSEGDGDDEDDDDGGDGSSHPGDIPGFESHRPHVEAVLSREGKVTPVAALNVSGNAVGPMACGELARWLPVAAALHTLNLSKCGIVDADGKVIVTAAEVCRVLFPCIAAC